MTFQGLEIFPNKIQDFPGGVGTLNENYITHCECTIHNLYENVTKNHIMKKFIIISCTVQYSSYVCRWYVQLSSDSWQHRSYLSSSEMTIKGQNIVTLIGNSKTATRLHKQPMDCDSQLTVTHLFTPTFCQRVILTRLPSFWCAIRVH